MTSPIPETAAADLPAGASGSPDPAAELRGLAILLDVSQALSGTLDLRGSLDRVLEILRRSHGVLRAAVTLLDPDSGHLYVAASSGLEPGGRRARYRLGEGITGRVVASGRPVVVPQVSREPLFLHRAADRSRQETTFICVPILVNRQPAGALAVDLAFEAGRDYDQAAKFIGVVGTQLAQAVKIQGLVEGERQRLTEENAHLREELRERYDFANLVGSSGPMRAVFEQIAQVAGTGTTVLIRGESGTGKELIAHAIHYHSPRAKLPFIKVSCAALPETLIESELFGYERGAFTGAHARKKGRFELAAGGTLFLDEIGELSLPTQVKLLRVLQQREFERLGGTETLRAGFRVIAATHKPLEQAVAAGTFREDLYYRLNVFAIGVPPLRERKPDIPLLADHFVEKHAREHGKSVRRISTPCIDMLMSYHWPGNVRELENAIERAVVVCDDRVLHAHHLPPTLQTAEASGTGFRRSLAVSVAALERDLISDALKSARGNRARAARLLDTTERIIGYKIRKLGIDAGRFRPDASASPRAAAGAP